LVARRCTLARLAFFAFIGFAFLAFTRLVAFLVTRAFRKLVLALLVAFVALTGLAFSRLAFTRLAFFLFAMSCLLQSLLIIDTDTRKSERLPPTSSRRQCAAHTSVWPIGRCNWPQLRCDPSCSVAPRPASAFRIPQTYSQNIDGALSGYGTQTEIAMDQINSLVANNEASSISNATDPWSVSVAAYTGEAHAGEIRQGSLNTGELQANTSTAASVDALTQSIVLGANIQNKSSTTTITGHDSHVEASAVGHSS
jgi:hypothetical protein